MEEITHASWDLEEAQRDVNRKIASNNLADLPRAKAVRDLCKQHHEDLLDRHKERRPQAPRQRRTQMTKKPNPSRKDRFAWKKGDCKIINVPAREENKVNNANHIDVEDLTRAALPILQRAAKARKVVFYGELADECKNSKLATPAWQGLTGHDPRLWQGLYNISRDSMDTNGFFLSAVVVHKDDNVPGNAFREWCDEETPGRNWVWHLRRAHKHHRFKQI